MTVKNINPQQFFFSNFHLIYYPEDQEKRKYFYTFHNSSCKHLQYHYCKNRIFDLIEQNTIDGEIILSITFETALCTYIESLLVNCRTSVDLAIKGLFLLTKSNPVLDSFAKFINDIDKHESYSKLYSFDYFQKLKDELYKDEFSWTRALFRIKSNKSMRDKVVHNQQIKFESIWSIEENQFLYIDTGEYKIKNESHIPIIKTVESYVTDIVNGTDGILNIIKDNVYKITDQN